jgi:hypothetical protein
MVVRFKEEVEEIPRSAAAAADDDIDGFFWPSPDESANDNGASVSFLDMFGSDDAADSLDDTFFEALHLNGATDNDYYFDYSFP